MTNARKAKVKRILAWAKLCLFAIIVIGIPLFLVINYREYVFDREWLKSLPIRLGSGKGMVYAIAILILAQAAQVVISFIPAGPFQITASYIYGVGPALLLSLVGCVLGSAIAFTIAKVLGHDAMYTIWGREKFEHYQEKLGQSRAIVLVFLFYLIPAIPKDMICYVAGLTDMKVSIFLTASTIARIPGMIGNLLIGTFIANHNYVGVAITMIVLTIIALEAYIHRDRLVSISEHSFFTGKKD